MKILLAAHATGLGGAERDLLELTDALRACSDATPIVAVPGRGELLDALRSRGVPVAVLPTRWWVSGRAHTLQRVVSSGVNAAAAPRARRLLRRAAPDLVVTFTLTVPVYAVAAHAQGIPHVWLAREFGVEDHGFAFHLGRDRSMQLVDRLSVLVGVPSQAVADRLSEWIPRSKLRQIRYAPSLAAGPPPAGRTSTSNALSLLLVGTMRESKGQRLALQALARLRQDGVPATLTLVGTGRAGYVRSLERQARALGVESATTFAGAVTDPTPFYDGADVLLLCSGAEAYGRVVVEAMQRGVPVVGSRAGGTVEQLSESGGGLLYETGDVPALTAAIQQLHRDPDLRARLGAAGRTWATTTFTPEQLAQTFLTVAREAVGAADADRRP